MRQRRREAVITGVARVVVRDIAHNRRRVSEPAECARRRNRLSKREAIQRVLGALACRVARADRALDVDQNDVGVGKERLEGREERVRSTALAKLRAEHACGFLRPKRVEVGA